MKNNFLILMICILSACATKQTADPEQSFLEKLNGNSYDHAENTNAVQVTNLITVNSEPKAAKRKFSGKIWCAEAPFQHPANNASVKVIENGKVLASSSSTPDGAYTISAFTPSVGSFTLVASSNCGEASQLVSGKYADRAPSYDFILKK